jgi:hypothetical protein
MARLPLVHPKYPAFGQDLAFRLLDTVDMFLVQDQENWGRRDRL